MKSSQAAPFPSSLTNLPGPTIPPCQVWEHLTVNQREHLRQTLLVICQEILVSTVRQEREGQDE